MPTQSHYGPTWVGPRAACRPPGREPWPHGVTAISKSFRTVRGAPPNSAARARGCFDSAPGRHHQIHSNAKTVDLEVSHRMLRVGHLGPDLM